MAAWLDVTRHGRVLAAAGGEPRLMGSVARLEQCGFFFRSLAQQEESGQ